MDENNKEETIKLIELIGYEKTLELLKGLMTGDTMKTLSTILLIHQLTLLIRLI